MDPGTLIADRFELEEVAGQGAAGVVYRARDRQSGERVALKIITTAAGAQRFEREARVLADIDHPHVVRYVAHGRADRRPYLAMEWLEGEELATRLERGTLSVEQTLALAKATASALAEAHRRGVVHRDLKPSNLFLVDGHAGRPKILDFGVAFQASIRDRSTHKGLAIGTPTYMAPEQAQAGNVDARADVFALGCVLFECLASRPAFQADRVLALMTKVLLEDPPPLREVAPEAPTELEALLARMMSKRREHRPADGGELVSSLDAIRLDVERPSAPPPSAIGASEQSLVSVLVVGKASDHEAARVTWTDLPPPDFEGDEVTEAADELGAADPVGSIATRYGGQREFLADGTAVVLLATSGSATEQAIRAARCALELRELAAGAPVALATGLAHVGARAPVGGVIDRVVELLGEAGDAELVVDDVTARLLPPRFAFDRDRLLAEEHSEGEGSPGHAFVGRDAELRELEERLIRTATDREASATLVLGEPGIGKSRLRRELMARRDKRWAVGFGWGDPMRTSAPYGVLALVLRSMLDLPAGGDFDTARGVLLERMEPLFASPDRERVAAFIGEVVGLPFPSAVHPALQGARLSERTMRSETERALWELLEAAAERHPVLLVLEDLQWCDRPTLELLDAALLFLSSHPFAVLGFARPELEDRVGELWAERGRHDLELRPLGDDAASALAREALGAKYANLAPLVVARSGGNPFYVEELSRAFLSQPELDTLPPTISALVQARLDRMPDDARRLLRAASVLGEQFDERALEALLGIDDGALGWLSALVDQGLLVRLEPLDAGRYAFQQSLLREAAYATLTDSDRALGHRLAAQHLAHRPAPTPSALAQHYEAGGQPREAAPWWARAARAALEANAVDEALGHASRGLEGGARGHVRHELLLLQARGGRTRGDWDLVEQAAEEVLAAVDPLSDRWWEALRWAALAHRTRGNRAAAERLVRSAVEGIGTAVLDYPSLAQVMRIAHTALLIGEVPSAVELLAAVDAHLPDEEIPYVGLRAERLSVEAEIKLYRGDLGAFLEAMRRRYDLAAEAGLDFTTVATAPNLGFAFLLVGAYDRAEAVLRAGIELARSLHMPTVEAWTQHNLGLCLAYLERLDEALEVETAALRYGETGGDRRLVANALSYLSAIHLARGALDEAEDAAARAVEIAREVAPPAVPFALAAQATAALRRGHAERARELVGDLVAEIDAGAPIADGEAQLRLAHAEALKAAGRDEEARAAIARAAERLHERAAHISDEEHRRSFLERVEANARTLALSAQWG